MGGGTNPDRKWSFGRYLYTLQLCTDHVVMCSWKKTKWHHLPDNSHDDKWLQSHLMHPPLSTHAPHLPQMCHQWTNTKQTAQTILVVVWAVEYVSFSLNLISSTNYSLFLVSCLLLGCHLAIINAPEPLLYPSNPLCHCCKPLLTGWQQVLFLDSNSNGTMATMSQHHHPTCKRLLIGGDGGADNDGTRTTNDNANKWMPMNTKQQGQWTQGITNSREDEQTGEVVGKRWGQQMAGTTWMTNKNTATMSDTHLALMNTMAAPPHSCVKCKTVGQMRILYGPNYHLQSWLTWEALCQLWDGRRLEMHRLPGSSDRKSVV